jgi:hypothetical protein
MPLINNDRIGRIVARIGFTAALLASVAALLCVAGLITIAVWLWLGTR